MSLVRIFAEHAAGSSHDGAHPLAAATGVLESALAQLVAAGQAAWPQIELSPEVFVRFLARQLPPNVVASAELSALCAGELYLICALGRGHPAALAAFVANYMPAVRRTLQRLQTPEPLIEDIIQGLYGHLLERQNSPPDAVGLRRGYSGRGDLKSWLCVCAVHAAAKRNKRERREVALEQAPEAVLPEQARTPELALLSGELKGLFETAFRQAVAELTSRERNLLRYHFLSGLSIDQIGTLYRVHRATAARWVAQARQRLAKRTRQRFLAAVPMQPHSYAQLMALVRSQLTSNFATLLKQVTVEDLPLSKIAPKE